MSINYYRTLQNIENQHKLMKRKTINTIQNVCVCVWQPYYKFVIIEFIFVFSTLHY